MVRLIAESINSCFTMIALVFMPIIFWRAISFCEKTWKVDLHIAKDFIVICDLLIIIGFVGHGLGL
jgi:hypothetical protein